MPFRFQDLHISLLSFLIHAYKWLELQVLRLFRPLVERKVINIYESVGITLEIDGLSKSSSKTASLPKPVKGSDKQTAPVHVRIRDRDVLLNIANRGPNLALGEAYMDGRIEISDIGEMVRRFMFKDLHMIYWNPWNKLLTNLEFVFLNLQTKTRAYDVAKVHYDLGDDLFESFLDPKWMMYSSGYYNKPNMTLLEAQEAKMDLLARKLQLKPGMTMLDIGCGWGSFCKYVAKNYDVKCVGITVSKDGVAYARKLCKGLNVDIQLMDYRDLKGTFDRVVSIGMMEHVGYQNYAEFFKVAHRCLKPDGIFIFEVIGFHDKNKMVRMDSYFHKYIYPNGCLPYYKDITDFTEGLFYLEDWHNFGADYAKTLEHWMENFERNSPLICKKYGERLFRMWKYYFEGCAGGFQSRRVTNWHVVLSKEGLEEYRSQR